MLPTSALGRAIDYTLGLWDRLCVYLGNGHVEIDNNGIENAIRPTAIGKKNWLFIGREDTGERSAVIYTLIESAKRHGHEPYAYLKDLWSVPLKNWTGNKLDLEPYFRKRGPDRLCTVVAPALS